MKLISTKIKGLEIIEPVIYEDDRGYFFESYQKERLLDLGLDFDFIQDNEAYSTRGVLRGLHYQTGDYAQTKLVRVSFGEVLDVVVDIRPNSETYGQHFSISLSAKNKRQLLVPAGFAHGYLALSEIAIFNYKVDQVYDKASEGGIIWNDPQLNINWDFDLQK